MTGIYRPAPLVLVVDDDATSTASLTSWLYSEGFNAVSAASCLEARAVLHAMPIEGLIGHLALRDGSLFDLGRLLRVRRGGAPTVIVGYADVPVRIPPELDACFVRPLDLHVLGSFLGARLGRRRSGEVRVRIGDHALPPAAPPPAVVRARRR